MTRAEWGARTDLPRLGEIVDPDAATHLFIHHPVGVDNDATPNVFETVEECVRRMRGLQTVRPDLGLDVPYNWVAFLMEDQVLICEGRGAYRKGAHTQWHNVDGRAICVYGDFQTHPVFGLARWMPTLGHFAWDVRTGNAAATAGGAPLRNLGNAKPAPGRDAWGHREAKDPEGNNVSGGTSCPGTYLFAELHHIKIQPAEEDDMALSDDDKKWIGDLLGAGHMYAGDPRNPTFEGNASLPGWIRRHLVLDTRFHAAIATAVARHLVLDTQFHDVIATAVAKKLGGSGTGGTSAEAVADEIAKRLKD